MSAVRSEKLETRGLDNLGYVAETSVRNPRCSRTGVFIYILHLLFLKESAADPGGGVNWPSLDFVKYEGPLVG